MLPVASRLRRRIDFSVTIRRGRRASRGAIVVHLTNVVSDSRSMTRPEEQTPRAGFVVSKAVGNAVVRNRIKRRLRHLVAERLALLPSATSLVVRALPSASSRSYSQLGNDLDAALRAVRSPRHGGDR